VLCSVLSPTSTCPEGWGEGGEPDPSDDDIWNVLYAKAEDVKAFAKSYGLTILMLQPLNQFDGWPAGSPRAQWVRRKAERWLPLCAKLGVEMLQVRAQLCVAVVHKRAGSSQPSLMSQVRSGPTTSATRRAPMTPRHSTSGGSRSSARVSSRRSRSLMRLGASPGEWPTGSTLGSWSRRG
jgi:hypothetical protein